MTWFLCAGRKSLGFRVNVEVELVFVCVVVIDLISELGSDLTLFQCRDEIGLGVVWVVKIDLIPVWGIRLTLILV